MKSHIAFIGLVTEYCQTVEACASSEKSAFIDAMLRLLPRIYITAYDLEVYSLTEEPYTQSVLDEEGYEEVRRTVAALMGEEDDYLETVMEDMRYSDTPVAASISECVADMFQVFFNFLSMVKDAPDDVMQEGLAAVKDEFKVYWSQILCNTLRALNEVKFNKTI